MNRKTESYHEETLSLLVVPEVVNMMTSSNGNIFRVTGLLCGEFTGHRWITRTKASDAEFHDFCAFTNNWANNGDAGYLRRHCNETINLGVAMTTPSFRWMLSTTNWVWIWTSLCLTPNPCYWRSSGSDFRVKRKYAKQWPIVNWDF